MRWQQIFDGLKGYALAVSRVCQSRLLNETWNNGSFVVIKFVCELRICRDTPSKGTICYPVGWDGSSWGPKLIGNGLASQAQKQLLILAANHFLGGLVCKVH